jgi:hypothetical protein
MNLAAKPIWSFVRNVVRDLGAQWIRSLVLRLVLTTLALAALVAAVGLLVGLVHTVLSGAIGPVYASLVVAALLGLAAAGLYLANRLVRRGAIRRREEAKALALSTLSFARAAADKDGLSILTVALLVGLIVGSRPGASAPEGRSAATG